MELNEYVLNSSLLIIISLLLMIFLSDFAWLIAIFMILVNTLIKIKQVEEHEPKLSINRTILGKTFQEAERIKVILTITNLSKYTFRGEIADELPRSAYVWEGSNLLLLQIYPNQTLEFTYVFSYPRRGKYTVGPFHIRYHSLGENHESSWILKKIHKFVVIPNPEAISSYNLAPGFLTALGGPFRSKLVGDGTDFAGIREYRYGDPFRRINWKQTAKLKLLHSNEFEINRATDIIIVLDLTEEAIEVTDASVRTVLGLIDYLIHARCKVGLITLGEYIHFIPPKTGKRHLLEISEHLTNVKSIESVVNLDLFQQRLNQTISKYSYSNNEILLFSSLNKLENAHLLSNILPKLGKVTVITPTVSMLPENTNELLRFSSQILQLRKQIIGHYLMKKDIRIYEWIPDLPFELSISRWRTRK